MVALLIGVLLAALVYWLLSVLTGSFIVAVVGAILVLLVAFGGFGRGL